MVGITKVCSVFIFFIAKKMISCLCTVKIQLMVVSDVTRLFCPLPKWANWQPKLLEHHGRTRICTVTFYKKNYCNVDVSWWLWQITKGVTSWMSCLTVDLNYIQSITFFTWALEKGHPVFICTIMSCLWSLTGFKGPLVLEVFTSLYRLLG